MPIFDRECILCGYTIEVLEKLKDDIDLDCEKCSSTKTIKRIVSGTHFRCYDKDPKNGGFYAPNLNQWRPS